MLLPGLSLLQVENRSSKNRIISKRTFCRSQTALDTAELNVSERSGRGPVAAGHFPGMKALNALLMNCPVDGETDGQFV